jgi:hypothetical protein
MIAARIARSEPHFGRGMKNASPHDMTPTPDNWGMQLFWLLILAIPIACIARTVVFEEVFREPREYCERQAENAPSLAKRKFFYLFTCEYCFSHYVTIAFLFMTRYRLLIDDWRGYVIALFALVLVANSYLNLYARLRIDITSEKKAIEHKEKVIEAVEKDIETKDRHIRKMDAETTEATTRS